MLRNLVIIFCLWLGVSVLWKYDVAAGYDQLLLYIAGHGPFLFGVVTAVSVLVIVVALILGSLDLYALMYLLCRVAFEVSQFAIALISVAAVIFWFDKGILVWQDLGFLGTFGPFELLAASLYGFRLFDFNYPMADRMLRNLAVPLISGIIIYGSQLFG